MSGNPAGALAPDPELADIAHYLCDYAVTNPDALAAARRINPALTSIAVARASESGSGGPRYIELRQATLDAGLRKLGVEER